MLIPVPAYSHQLLSLIISQRKEAILNHGQITHHLGRRSSSEATGFSRVAASQHYTRRLLPYAYDVRLLVGLVLVWGFPGAAGSFRVWWRHSFLSYLCRRGAKDYQCLHTMGRVRYYALTLVSVCLLLLAASSQAQNCGKRKQVNLLITNGLESKEGDWPWHVALFHNNRRSFEYACGGSILDQNTILTGKTQTCL